QLLGRGPGRADGRHGGRPDRRFCDRLVLDLYVHPADRCRDLPGARPVRQEERARSMNTPRLSKHEGARAPSALITPSMLVAFLIFGTLPYWINEIGLYPYLGVEVLIWCIFALGFNLLLGYTGLPSFGHGAFFGIGAYAMGLIQFNLVPNLWLGLIGATIAG